MLGKTSPLVIAYRSNPRGWAIVTFIFIALGFVFSARSALGLIMPAWEEDLGWDRTFLSSGGSIILIFMTLISPLAGNLLDRFVNDPAVAIYPPILCNWRSWLRFIGGTPGIRHNSPTVR